MIASGHHLAGSLVMLQEPHMVWRRVSPVILSILVLAPGGCGPKVNNQLLGTWEPAEKGDQYTLEFGKDGKVGLTGERFQSLGQTFRFAKLLGDFNIQPGKSIEITYRPLNDRQLEIMADYTAMLQKLSMGGDSTKLPRELGKDIKPRDTVTYAVAGDELTLTNEEGKVIKLRRTR
jgi:hypothetical protein